MGYLSEVLCLESDQPWMLSGECKAVSRAAESCLGRLISEPAQPGWQEKPRPEDGRVYGSLETQMDSAVVALWERKSGRQIVQSSDSCQCYGPSSQKGTKVYAMFGLFHIS